MKVKRILKGNSDFKYIISNNGYFVDKTILIKEFYDNGDYVVILPRPRRFGKTLNLSMIEHFFDISKKESAGLFSEYKISAEKEFCEQHQNRYPVINLTLKNVKGNDWKGCLQKLRAIISELYDKHKFLLKSDKLEDYEKENIKQIILKKAPQVDIEFSLKNLSKYLTTHFGQKTIILLDEYDAPIISGYSKKYYDEIITFMQGFLGLAFKQNDFVHKGLLTGILRVARESLFSEFNNSGVYTITSRYFSERFGFTEQETKDVLKYFGLQDNFEDVKQWYDGYQFGEIKDIYNPWSIVNYIANYHDGFQPYWINSGTDSLVKERVLEPDVDQTYDDLQKLISGEILIKTLDENFVFSDFETNKGLFWTLLTFSGYLTQTKKINWKTYELKIPNFEIKTIFQNIVITWLQISLKVKKETLETTAQHLINNRIGKFEKGLKKIMDDTFSYFDTIGGDREVVYQSYVLGLLAIIGDDYVIKSNRESGEGKYDIMLIPHLKTKYGVVIEIKQIDKRGEKEVDDEFNKRINSKITEALNQIDRNKYYKELIAHKIKNIIKLPIVFAGKEPFLTLLPNAQI